MSSKTTHKTRKVHSISIIKCIGYFLLISTLFSFKCSTVDLSKFGGWQDETIEYAYTAGLIHGQNEPADVEKILNEVVTTTYIDQQAAWIELTPAGDGRIAAALKILLKSDCDLIIIVNPWQEEERRNLVEETIQSNPKIHFIILSESNDWIPKENLGNLTNIDITNTDNIKTEILNIINTIE